MAWDRSLPPGESSPRTKLILRSFTLLLTTIGLILTGLSLIYTWPLFIPLSLSFLWNLANIIRRLTAQTPVVPGANVGVDLIIWLVFVATLLFTWASAIEAVSFVSDYYGYEYDSYRGYYGYGYGSRYGDAGNGAEIAVGAAAMATLVFVFTVALWVWACVDCHRYRFLERYPVYRRGIKGGTGYPGPMVLQTDAVQGV